MKLLVLTALIAAVASGPLSGETNVQNQPQWPWLVGKLYRYDVESHTLARLQEGASTGNAFRARFIVRVRSPGRLQAKLENPQHALVHQDLPQGKLPSVLKYEPVQNLDKPFEISLDGGRILSLSLPASLSLAQENLLKGLIGALQVDLSTHRSVRSQKSNYDKDVQQGQFRKMETDVTGDCETLYTVSPVASEWRRELPHFSLIEEPIEITKSKNYGHCHHRVSYHFGVPVDAQWTRSASKSREDAFIKRATTSRMLVGKQGTIFKTETTSTVNVHPHMYGKQKAEVYSYVKLTLDTYEQDNEAEWQKPENNRVVLNLLYSMTTKQVAINDASSSSSESQEEQDAGTPQSRGRRSARPSRIVSINKLIIKKRSDEDSSSSSSSSDSESLFVNDEIPKIYEPAYAALYMNPQPRADKKQNQINAQKLVQEIAQQLQNPNNMPKADTLSKFNILVRVIAAMNSEQLAQISRSIEVAKSSNNIVKTDMWMVFRDAVAQAGTLPAFKQIQSWIQEKKLQGEEAAEVVASLVNTLRYPTKEAMTQFFKLALSPEVIHQKYLNSTALIAATKFINMGQVNNETAHSYYPTHMYGRFARKHDNFVLEEVLPRLRQGLEQAIEEKDSRKAQVYIKAIGNLGHRSILEVFAPYIQGKIPVSNYLRTLMVENLFILAHQKDGFARSVLYNILRNTAEPYEIRVVAIQNIFLAYPTTAMMQAMAQMTHDDPSVHVRAALKSSIESAAELKNPRYLELARTARGASSMLTKEKFGKHFSAKIYNEYFDNEYELGIMSVLSYIGSEDNLFPKYLSYAQKSKTSGWSTISSSVSSVQHFIDYYKQQMSRMWQQGPKSESDHKYSANKISEMLNIKRDPQNPLEGALYIKLLNQERYFPFSEEELNELPKIMRDYVTDLPNGVEKHYTKILNQAQVSVMFPVAMGMPFIFKYKEPTVIHIQAKAKGRFSFPNAGNKDYTADFEKEIQMTFARNIDGTVGFLDTLVNQYAAAGIVNKVHLNIPVNVKLEMKSGEVKVHLEPRHSDMDTTIAHFSVWPYTTSQKMDTLVSVSLDPNTKLITRDSKVSSIDYRFGQTTGTPFQVQGYSYSSDYRNVGIMFSSRDWLSNIAWALYQKDVALTHFNFRYLGKQSQNKGVTVSAKYGVYYDQKHESQEPLTATNVEDISPNSESRRQEMVKRVVSGMKSDNKVQLVDLSATFDGAQKQEYVLTAAIADSHTDPKIQYVFFAGRNSAQQGNSQVNAVGTVQKPTTYTLNFIEALKNEMKMNFDFDIKYGQANGNIHIQGFSERTKKYAESLQNLPLAKQCVKEMESNNLYQHACHKMIVMAHAPDYLKASVTYKDVSPAFKYMTFQAYRIVENWAFWFTEVNPLKTTPEGKLDIELNVSYLDHNMNLQMNSKYGEVRVKNAPIPKVTAGALAIYSPIMPFDRFANYYFGHQYLPYCTVDGNKIKTFSSRTIDYTLTRAWYVVMQDVVNRPQNRWQHDDELVVLARRPNERQQEIYISYKSGNGQDVEIEIQPAQEGSMKPIVRVNTNAKKVSDGDRIMYWDETDQSPLLRYFIEKDGVLLMVIKNKRLRVRYDGQRLVVLANQRRNNTRGICGAMSGERHDDYLTPRGLVDKPEHYAASYALRDDNSDPKTMQLQAEAQKVAYQPENKYTIILRSDKEWQNAMQGDSPTSEEIWGAENVYRVRGYSKMRGQCQLSPQVQFYENHGEICITTTPLDACQSHCSGDNYKVQPVQVVCRPKLDQDFQEWRNQIRMGQNPQVAGVPRIRQYRVPTSCKA